MTDLRHCPATAGEAAPQAAPGEAFGVLRLPAQVSFGVGSLAALPREAAALGSRVLVCADPFIAATAPFGDVIDRMRSSGLQVAVDTHIVPELPVEAVHAAADRARPQEPDLVVGIGGGSALDQAKLVALLLRHPGSLSNYYGENRVPGPVTPLIAVPTTAGTGSEVTPVAVVTDPERTLKVGVSSRELVPRVALVDPALTLGAPPAIAAYAGIDAFVHAIEAFTAARRRPRWAETQPMFVGRNDLSSLMALEAVRTISGALRTAVAEPDDVPSHVAMSYGSLLAGMAFGSAGTHFSHALQYPVGAVTHTPHGLGTGLLLPHVLRVCSEAVSDELADIGQAMGVTPRQGEEPADATIAAIAALVRDIGVPSGLAEIGVDPHDLDRIADLALQAIRLAGNGPVPPSAQTFRKILDHALGRLAEEGTLNS